ncbi:unnamed protein product [Lampetra planeri]
MVAKEASSKRNLVSASPARAREGPAPSQTNIGRTDQQEGGCYFWKCLCGGERVGRGGVTDPAGHRRQTEWLHLNCHFPSPRADGAACRLRATLPTVLRAALPTELLSTLSTELRAALPTELLSALRTALANQLERGSPPGQWEAPGRGQQRAREPRRSRSSAPLASGPANGAKAGVVGLVPARLSFKHDSFVTIVIITIITIVTIIIVYKHTDSRTTLGGSTLGGSTLGGSTLGGSRSPPHSAVPERVRPDGISSHSLQGRAVCVEGEPGAGRGSPGAGSLDLGVG